jgi:16S rRNA (guanine527-N7)-methyltransferase
MNGIELPALKAKLELGLQEMGLEIAEPAQQKLLDYLALIHKWNKVHNLTAVRDPAEMVTLHLLDSLAVLPHIQAKRLLDVGSGAGLPGIPLAICLPELQVTVLDSIEKKASFMRQAKAELGLGNLEVVSSRVEQYKPGELYDVIISRAFSDLQLFTKLTRHLGAPGGQWLAMKGVQPDDELAQITIQPSRIEPLKVAGLEAQRHLVFLPFQAKEFNSEAIKPREVKPKVA